MLDLVRRCHALLSAGVFANSQLVVLHWILGLPVSQSLPVSLRYVPNVLCAGAVGSSQ